MKPTPTDAARYQYFPTSYAQGRAWFEAAIAAAGGYAERHLQPNSTGPDGESLSIGFGWIGAQDASRVYVSICGTHGQEYFCGAAGQLAWLDSKGPETLPKDVALAFIHALNPYGAAYFSRCNADFVDLNRNYRDMSVPLRKIPLFEIVAAALQTKGMSPSGFYEILETFNKLLENNDKAKVMDALAGGQSIYPSNIAYAGKQRAWEIQTLDDLLRTHFQKARKVAIIDWHTGLGPNGAATPINSLQPQTQAYDMAQSWWAKPAEISALYDSGAEPDIIGLVCEGAAQTLRSLGADVIETVIELGTVNNDAIIPAFLIDRWLRFECDDRQSPDAVELKTIMMERYSPSLPEWRASVLAEMQAVYDRVVAGLTSW
ncbi:MAG: DUF2817 domain-containing protein [Pseudomonadota bacterium]